MDTNWQYIDEFVGYKNETAGDGNIPAPKHLKEMLEYARILSKEFRFVRVDLYDTSEGVLFGELTFSHFSGFEPMEPMEWDDKFGSWLTLPKG